VVATPIIRGSTAARILPESKIREGKARADLAEWKVCPNNCFTVGLSYLSSAKLERVSSQRYAELSPRKAAKTKPNSNLSPDFHNPNTA
jgi:hypothetical protein